MKKIVAVVLALVMVLGLATTAFAATAGFESDVDDVIDNAVAGENDAWRYELEEADEADEEDQTFATYEVVAYALYKGAKAWWGTSEVADEVNDDFDIPGEFVKVVNADEADMIIVDGKDITYLAYVADYTEWTLKAKEIYIPYCVDEKWECDTMYALNPAGAWVYEDAKGNLYAAAATGMILNVDGAAVTAVPLSVEAGIYDASEDVNDVAVDTKDTDDVLVYTGHEYEADSKGNSYTEAALEKIYCDGCGKSFKYVLGGTTDAIKAFGADYYPAGTWGTANNAPMIYVGTAAGAAAGTTDAPAAGEKVESAKTFDAGIAMYVGMSVMAAAGSAVVLKKKD